MSRYVPTCIDALSAQRWCGAAVWLSCVTPRGHLGIHDPGSSYARCRLHHESGAPMPEL